MSMRIDKGKGRFYDKQKEFGQKGVEEMTVSEFYERFSSDCAAGCGNQLLAKHPKEVTKTNRCWFRLSFGGEHYALLLSNEIDSTYDDGSISRPGDVGEWTIHGIRVGLCREVQEEPAAWQEVTFSGKREKKVTGKEPFVTDPIALGAKAGDWLCYEITFTGSCYPYHEEAVLTMVPDKQMPLPLMIGSDRPVKEKIGFWGDSITQGCGTEDDSYTHWVARIAEKLPEISVWDLGIGYARASDAAIQGGWMERAKQCQTIHVCFGVNDILRNRKAEEILWDLEIIIDTLKEAGCRVILLTLPPFDLEGEQRVQWQKVNAAIRERLCREADGFFDIAAVLGQEVPNEHRCIYGGHPNAEGCKAVAEAYLKGR